MHAAKSRILASALLTAGILAMGAIAQPGGGAPECCKYNYSWPNGENDCGLDENRTAQSCETSSPGAPATDPLARKTGIFNRNAECCVFDVGSLGSFHRVSCDAQPCTHARLVAPLSDGTCCWACGAGGPATKDCWSILYTSVYSCLASCVDKE